MFNHSPVLKNGIDSVQNVVTTYTMIANVPIISVSGTVYDPDQEEININTTMVLDHITAGVVRTVAPEPVIREGPGGSPSAVMRPPEGFGHGAVSGLGLLSVIFIALGMSGVSAGGFSGALTEPGLSPVLSGDPAGVGGDSVWSGV